MGKSEMRVLNFDTPIKTTSRYRSILATLLFIICVPISLYRLIPSFREASDPFISDMATRIQAQTSGGGFCTKEIGGAQCCALYLDAAPCVDECRKQHVDRVTFTLTRKYDECVDVCLATYTATCQYGRQGDR